MWLCWKHDQSYDIGRIRVCRCKNVIMTKNDPGYDISGIRVYKYKNVIMMKKWPMLWY